MADNNEFLPSSYEIPEEPSQFMEIEEGRNKFRVLSSAVIGYEYWVEADGKRKPVRVQTEAEVPEEYLNTGNWKKDAKHFWAFAVYNYQTETIQVLELTQKKIMKAIKSLMVDWGHPTGYDLIIEKTKIGSESKDVEYQVKPLPPQPLQEGIMEYYQSLNVDLNALFKGEYPIQN